VALILNIETSTEVCSVCTSENSQLLAIEEENKANSHSSVITLLIQRLFEKSSRNLQEIDAVAVSAGPGSFTGLRIGASVAKGLCYALDKPLLAIPTTQAMAAGTIEQVKDKDALYCAVVDSIKDELYAELYDANLVPVVRTQPADSRLKDFIQHLGKKTTYFFGSGVEKLKIMDFEEVKLITGFLNSSKNMIGLAHSFFAEKKFASVESFEPDYLKSFVSRVKQ